MCNKTLKTAMKTSLSNGEHCIRVNTQELSELDIMVKKGYLENYDVITEMGEKNDEKEIIFYPTPKFHEL
ncbi:hypothetical protein [Staphylococcus simulans]|uniref:hypothetical protein n=1 Tax=Staphylococcus simulans TaxID=1286 RepID=UPI000F6EF4E2|nr:hypothetical protein [Staphylococcus simulans]VED60382.1 Uncharacterised protein [Staphylococcus simulans]